MSRTGKSAERRRRGALESEVLAALWAADTALVPADVQQALGDDIAYNTVQTILIRLHDKQLVTRERVGRAHAYRPAHGQAELAAQRMHQVLDGDIDHAAVLLRFVTSLNPADAQALRSLISDPPDDGLVPDPTPG